jgi:hypothetical protein
VRILVTGGERNERARPPDRTLDRGDGMTPPAVARAAANVLVTGPALRDNRRRPLKGSGEG